MQVSLSSADDFIAPPCLEEITILLQDEHILLINKPSGLLSLSGKNPANLDSVHYRLVKDFPGCSLVHRLDLGTSGIMVVARNKQINAQLCKQFSERTVLKTYTALLFSTLNNDKGFIDAPIAKDKPNFPLMKICDKEGKNARTLYRVLDEGCYARLTGNIESTAASQQTDPHSASATRVEFFPETGRTHQLRIHSQYLGHPIIGCDLYGTAESYQLATRLMLHATQLEFDHPVTNERIIGLSPCPF